MNDIQTAELRKTLNQYFPKETTRQPLLTTLTHLTQKIIRDAEIWDNTGAPKINAITRSARELDALVKEHFRESDK
jgi:hypothetical protein